MVKELDSNPNEVGFCIIIFFPGYLSGWVKYHTASLLPWPLNALHT
jgi:hypothetical protein